MSGGRHAPPRAAGAIPWWFHVAVAAWIAGVVLLARLAPLRYAAAMQEDRATEWFTFALFAAAAGVHGARASGGRRLGDALTALFCFAAAGEEISWGQRLLGFVPPDLFLARNAQQEANFHNLLEPLGQPKWTLIAILLAYGVLAPLLVRSAVGRRMAARAGFTAAPLSLAPWFVFAVALLIAYPLRYTGEWVEAMSGALFLAAAVPRERTLGLCIAVGAAFAVAMSGAAVAGTMERSGLAGVGTSDPRACAMAELAAVAPQLARAPVGRTTRRVHRRLRALVTDGQAGDEGAVAEAWSGVRCADEPAALAARRHAYAIDPWGTAYWVRSGPGARIVYSFGPDRRRDTEPGGDDIVASFAAGPGTDAGGP